MYTWILGNFILTPNNLSKFFKSAAAAAKLKVSSTILCRLSTLSNSSSQIAGTTELRYKNTEGQNLRKLKQFILKLNDLLQIFMLVFIFFK